MRNRICWSSGCGSTVQKRVAATDEQLARGAAWGTLGEGAYAGAAPLAMTKVTICPVPEDFCVESVIVDDHAARPVFRLLGRSCVRVALRLQRRLQLAGSVHF